MWNKLKQVAQYLTISRLGEETTATEAPAPKPSKLPKGVGEPVYTIVQSIMNEKHRWKLSCASDAMEVYNSLHRSYGRNTARQTFTLLDTKTGESFEFLACAQVQWSRRYPWSPHSVIPMLDRLVHIKADWPTEEERKWAIFHLGVWYNARLEKLRAFQDGREQRRRARSDALQQILKDKERKRLLDIYT